ncbi:vanillyl alcohol oxidase [Thozetella sp. PMI_491]|nr:vanillyl alcohol oxidase [Thozetella sp. PMI_491]
MLVKEPRALPPKLTQEQFQQFIVRARELCGPENVQVVAKGEELEGTDYENQPKSHDLFYLYEKDFLVASAVVRPRNVPDVQAIMRLCNEFIVPVWPISIGRNVGYGGASPRVPGSIILDMGYHMNRILEVNVEGAYALLEPGVTFQKLHEYLESHKLRDHLWMSVPVGNGSVMGNAVERGVGATPYGDHWMMHCGLEVVLPSGELIRTGMGSLPNPNADPNQRLDEQKGPETWQLFPYGYGPQNDGIFSQSNLGVVTKMGLWLMPNPGGYQAYEFTFENDSDLPKIIEIIRPLRLQMILQNVPMVRHVLLNAAHCGPKEKYTSNKGVLSEEEIDGIAKKLDMGRWSLVGAVYGPEPVRNILLSVIKKSFLAIPGSRYFTPEDREDWSPLSSRAKLMQGIPSTDELRCLKWLGPNGGQLLFAPISKVTGEDATTQHKVAVEIIRKEGFDYLGAFAVGMRELHHVIGIPYRLDSAEDRRRLTRVGKTLLAEAAARGWGVFRVHTALMDATADTFNFNHHIQMKFNEAIKNTVDPNGILAPGKNGIWHKNFEQRDWSVNGY